MVMMISLMTATLPTDFLGLTSMAVLILTKTAGQITIHCIELVMCFPIIGNKHLILMVIHMAIIMVQTAVILGTIPMQEQATFSHSIQDNILIMITMDMVIILVIS